MRGCASCHAIEVSDKHHALEEGFCTAYAEPYNHSANRCYFSAHQHLAFPCRRGLQDVDRLELEQLASDVHDPAFGVEARAGVGWLRYMYNTTTFTGGTVRTVHET